MITASVPRIASQAARGSCGRVNAAPRLAEVAVGAAGVATGAAVGAAGAERWDGAAAARAAWNCGSVGASSM